MSIGETYLVRLDGRVAQFIATQYGAVLRVERRSGGHRMVEARADQLERASALASEDVVVRAFVSPGGCRLLSIDADRAYPASHLSHAACGRHVLSRWGRLLGRLARAR